MFLPLTVRRYFDTLTAGGVGVATWDELEAALRRRVQGERLAHVYRVLDTARQLADRHDVDRERTALAALMHDYAKAMPAAELLAVARRHNLISDPAEERSPGPLLHAPVGAALLREEGLIDDPAVLQAIARHTTGEPEMSDLDMVIWLADYIEPGRTFPGVEEMRRLAFSDLHRGLLAGLDSTIAYVLGRGMYLHLATVRTRNWLLDRVQRPESGSFAGNPASQNKEEPDEPSGIR